MDPVSTPMQRIAAGGNLALMALCAGSMSSTWNAGRTALTEGANLSILGRELLTVGPGWGAVALQSGKVLAQVIAIRSLPVAWNLVGAYNAQKPYTWTNVWSDFSGGIFDPV